MAQFTRCPFCQEGFESKAAMSRHRGGCAVRRCHICGSEKLDGWKCPQGHTQKQEVDHMRAAR